MGGGRGVSVYNVTSTGPGPAAVPDPAHRENAAPRTGRAGGPVGLRPHGAALPASLSSLERCVVCVCVCELYVYMVSVCVCVPSGTKCWCACVCLRVCVCVCVCELTQ